MPNYVVPEPGRGFQAVGEYDSLALLLERVLEGPEGDGIVHTMVGQDRLTPVERRRKAKEMVQKAMGEAGVSGVGEAVAGILTNPWVWLTVATGPWAGPAVSQVAKGLPVFAVKKQFSAYMKRSGMVGMAHALGFSTHNQLLDGTPAPAVMHQIYATKVKGDDFVARMVGPEYTRLLKQLSAKTGEEISSLDPGGARSQFAKDEVLRVNYALGMHRTGLGMGTGVRKYVGEGRSRYFLMERGADGQYTPRTLRPGDPDPRFPGQQISQIKGEVERVVADMRREERNRRNAFEMQARETGRPMWHYEPKWTIVEELEDIVHYDVPGLKRQPSFRPEERALIDQVLEEYGLTQYEQVRDHAVRTLAVQLMGRWSEFEATGKFVVDPQKISKLFDSMRAASHWQTSREVNPQLQGLALLEKVFEVPFLRGRSRELMGSNEAVRLIKEYYEPALNREVRAGQYAKYVGWNTVRQVDVDGVDLAPDILRDIAHSPLYMEEAGRAVGLTQDKLNLQPRDLREIHRLFGGRGFLEMAHEVEEEARKSVGEGKIFLAHEIRPFASDEKYMRETVTAYAAHIQPLSEEVIEAQHRTLQYADPKKAELLRLPKSRRPELMGDETEPGSVPYSISWKEIRDYPELREGWGKRLPGFSSDPAEAISPMMAFRYVVDLVPDPWVREAARVHAQDAMLGATSLDHTVSKTLHLTAKQGMAAFAAGPVGRAIHGAGKWGRDFIRQVETWADPLQNPPPGGGFSGQLAKYLYVTHLGLNLGSVVMNLTQPMLLAGGVVGMKHLLPAYVDAVKEMMNYGKLRMARYGFKPITEAERMGLIRSSFKYAGRETAGNNVLQIGGDVFHNIDSFIQAQRGTRKTGVLDWTMKPFEKSEWLVRNVAAHAMGRVYKEAKQATSSARFFSDVTRFVGETQYASSPLNTPRVFMRGMLSNPLMRQFLTFPLRTFTQAAVFTPILMERGWMEGFAKTFATGMGVSAVIHEVGKGTLGADLSGSLFWQASTDLFGGSRLTDQQGDVLPVPPFIDIPVDFIRGVAGDDLRLMRDALWRSLPAGVAAKRLLGTLPEMPLLGGLQPSYADWGHTDEFGRVPVYSDEGALMEMRSPSRMVYRALGVDLGTWNQSGRLDGYLVKQRDLISQYRHSYLRALGANDIGKAQGIANEFSRRFRDPDTGKPLPLTINQQQLTAYLQSQQVTRTERVLDRMDPTTRPIYQRMVGATDVGLNLPQREQLEQRATASQRDRSMRGALSRSDMERLMRESGIPGTTTERGEGYSPFTGFNGF